MFTFANKFSAVLAAVSVVVSIWAFPAAAKDGAGVSERISPDGKIKTVLLDGGVSTDKYWFGKAIDVVAGNSLFEAPFREAMKRKYGDYSTKLRYNILTEHRGLAVDFKPVVPSAEKADWLAIGLKVGLVWFGGGALGASTSFNSVGDAYRLAYNINTAHQASTSAAPGLSGADAEGWAGEKGGNLVVYRLCRENPCSVVLAMSSDPSVSLEDLDGEALKGVLELAGLSD